MYEIDYPRLSVEQAISLTKVLEYMEDEKGDYDSPFITEEQRENHIYNHCLKLHGYLHTFGIKELLK